MLLWNTYGFYMGTPTGSIPDSLHATRLNFSTKLLYFPVVTYIVRDRMAWWEIIKSVARAELSTNFWSFHDS